jgi:hypothetical protein
MNVRKQRLWLAVAAITFVSFAAAAATAVIWSENFSNVSNWRIISDPGGGSSITSDGSRAALFVQAPQNLAAFGPKPGVAPLVAFDLADKGKYALSFTVSKLTLSLSYDIALDEFDAQTNYVGTIWQVFPSTSTSTFVGSTNVSLGALVYDTKTAYLLPKITVHTGDGSQTVEFSKMEFTGTSGQPRRSP